MNAEFFTEGGYQLLFGLTELPDIASIQKQFTAFLNQWGKPVEYEFLAETGNKVGILIPLKTQKHTFGYLLASRNYNEQTLEYKSNVYFFLQAVGLILENVLDRNTLINPSSQSEVNNQNISTTDKHRFIVEQSTDGIMLVDETGLVIEWNKSQERITGWSAAECIGKPLWEVRWRYMPTTERTPETLKRLKEAICRALNTGKSTVFRDTFEAEIERKDGTRRFEEVHSYPIKTSKGIMIGILTRDTTTKKLTEKELLRREAVLNALRYSGEVLLSATSWKNHAEGILAHLGEALHVSRMFIFECCSDGTNKYFNRLFEWCAPQITPQFGNPLLEKISLSNAPFDRWWKKLNSHELVAEKIDDLSASEKSFFERRNTKYLVAAPIFIGNTLWGFIGFSDEADGRKIDPIEHESILTIANNLGNVILREKSQLDLHESEMRERNRADELQALLDSTPAAVWIAYDPECKQITGNKAAYDMLHMPYGTNLSKTASDDSIAHIKLSFEGKEVAPEELPMQQAAATGRIFVNLQEKINFQNGPSIELAGNVVPLWDEKGQPKGAIGAFLDITQQKQAESNLRKRIQIMSLINSIDSLITTSFDTNLTLATIITHLISSSFADAACIFIMNEKTHLLDYIGGQGFRKSIPKNLHVKLGEGIAGSVAASAESNIVPITGSNNQGMIKALISNEDFTYCYSYPMIVKKHLKGVIEIFLRHPITSHDPERLELYEMVAKRAAIAIENGQLLENLEQTNLELLQAYDITIEGWSRAMDLRDKETEGHTLRVTQMAIKLARLASIQENEIQYVRWGALLHDIGKLGVPDSILLKPGTLSDEEWMIMKQHPVYAFQMLSPIKYLQLATDIPYCHHERWDGSGYPRGLSGDTIPLAARLFSVIDVWDALTSNRPYRPAWSKERALEYIQMNSGIQFDPFAVNLFFQLDNLNPII